MHVGGSKGSMSGNFAMGEANLLIVVGSRAVCQADCSGIGYPRTEAVINLNQDLHDLHHYNRTAALQGDIGASIRRLLQELAPRPAGEARRRWLSECAERKAEWKAFQRARAPRRSRSPTSRGGCRSSPSRRRWPRSARFAAHRDAVKLFDAGDVQANGFQLVEDDQPFQSFTESGASYMGFAASAVVERARGPSRLLDRLLRRRVDHLMNPQVLVDAVEHGARA